MSILFVVIFVVVAILVSRFHSGLNPADVDEVNKVLSDLEITHKSIDFEENGGLVDFENECTDLLKALGWTDVLFRMDLREIEARKRITRVAIASSRYGKRCSLVMSDDEACLPAYVFAESVKSFIQEHYRSIPYKVPMQRDHRIQNIEDGVDGEFFGTLDTGYVSPSARESAACLISWSIQVERLKKPAPAPAPESSSSPEPKESIFVAQAREEVAIVARDLRSLEEECTRILSNAGCSDIRFDMDVLAELAEKPSKAIRVETQRGDTACILIMLCDDTASVLMGAFKWFVSEYYSKLDFSDAIGSMASLLDCSVDDFVNVEENSFFGHIEHETGMLEWCIVTQEAKTSHTDFDDMTGEEFEDYCAEILEANGFEDVDTTRRSGDQGIDVLATKDMVKYGFQCKCLGTNVGNDAVREAYAGKAFYHCHVAAVITNRRFTPAAVAAARELGVVLWDREKLLELIEKANRQKARKE